MSNFTLAHPYRPLSGAGFFSANLRRKIVAAARAPRSIGPGATAAPTSPGFASQVVQALAPSVQEYASDAFDAVSPENSLPAPGTPGGEPAKSKMPFILGAGAIFALILLLKRK